MSSSLIGRRLGKYEITELLGQGGMATVYKGYRPDIDRFVAIKVLPPHPGRNHQFVERFRLEARTIAQLQHPHILPMHDYGSDGDILYLVMAFVDGGSLKDLINNGPVPIKDTETILRQVSSAMDYAHRRNVIHRDIKPDNILLDNEGHALLADFGIVKIMEGEGENSGLTATGGVLGTPAYMAPEQSQGIGVNNHADIYSLGVIVYEMITGRQPYQADTPMQVMLKHITDPVPTLSDFAGTLPPTLEPVMMKVLAKEPSERYETATEFAQEFLRAVHRDDSVPILTTSTRTQQNPPQVTATPPPTQPAPVTPVDTNTPYEVASTGTHESPGRGGTNPVLLLGGFAIIALLAVIVVLLALNNNPDDGNGRNIQLTTATPRPPTEVAATDPPVVAADPTSVPVAAARTYGRLSFSTTRELGDTVNLQVTGLARPGTGTDYVVWLKDTTTDEYLNIGSVAVDGLGNGVHRFVDSEGRMLPAHFNALLVSAETETGDAPTGDIVYSGLNAAVIRDALSEIFVSSSDGFENGSLYEGALAEAELAVVHTSYDHGNHDRFGLVNRTEHTINILMNTEIDYDGNNLAENPGFRLGVPGPLDKIEELLDFDFSAEGMRRDLQSDVVRMDSCIRNARQWLNELYELETGWTEITEEVEEEFAQSEILESEVIINKMIEGDDANRDNQIAGVRGECGLRQIPTFGLLIGNLDIQAGDVTS